MDRKMIEGVRAALDTMAELELAQQAKRNAEAKEAAEKLAAVKEHHEKDAEGNVIPHDDEDAVKEGKFKDMVIKKQDKAMGAKPVPTKKKEDATSADKKPENVVGPDGKTRTRMVPVTKKTEAKMDPVGKADADIDNDGDIDKSDEYLHNRRKAIKKAMKKEDMDIQETNHVYSDDMLKSGLGHAKRAGMTVTHHGSSPFGERATISHKDPKKLAKYVNKHLGGMDNVEKRTSTKESTRIRGKLMSIWEDAAEINEADRAAHYKGATKPENMPKDDARSDKKMMDASPMKKHGKGEKEDPESKKAEDSTKPSAMRNNDNKQGDKAVMKSATPDHPAHKTTKEQVEEIKAAYESMYKKEDENGS